MMSRDYQTSHERQLGQPTAVHWRITLFCSADSRSRGIKNRQLSNVTLRPDQGVRSWDDFVQAVVGENTYVNIHSQVNPGGEIRGPLLLKK